MDNGGRFAEIRANLRRVHKIPLPDGPPDLTGADGYDHAAHHAAFLAFLGFLKVNLSGQTSIRVDPSWASQQVILQGIAQFALPDLLLREEELSTALPRLATDMGRSDPPDYGSGEHPMQGWLSAIYDRRIEQAAREAYARDYQIFGFKDWA